MITEPVVIIIDLRRIMGYKKAFKTQANKIK